MKTKSKLNQPSAFHKTGWGNGRQVIFFMLSVIIVTASAPAVFASLTWDITYDANVLPGSDGWLVANSINATVSNGKLHIPWAHGYYQIYRNDALISMDTGFTIEARLKVIYSATTHLSVVFEDDLIGKGAYLMFYNDHIRASGITYNMDTRDDYHTYRVCSSIALGTHVYVDGVLKIEAPLYDMNIYYGNVQWGDGATSIDTDSYWDYLYYAYEDFTGSGAVPELPTGMMAFVSALFGATWIRGRKTKMNREKTRN